MNVISITFTAHYFVVGNMQLYEKQSPEKVELKFFFLLCNGATKCNFFSFIVIYR